MSSLDKTENSEKNILVDDNGNIRLSYSRVRTYNYCPLKYKLMYEDGWRERLTPQSSLGLSLHRALEQFHKNRGMTLDVLFECLDEYWVNSGFESAQDSYESYDKARHILEKYFEEWQQDKGEIIHVEKRFSFSVEGVMLRGIIDRIDKTPEGTYEVIDYKTRVRLNDKNGHNLGLQLGIYYLACESMFGIAPAKVSCLCLTTGEKTVKEMDVSAKKELLGMLKNTVEKIKKKDFTPDKSKCERCDFSGKCLKK